MAYVPVDHPERACLICGTVFKPKQVQVVCCSSKCRQKHKYRTDHPDAKTREQITAEALERNTRHCEVCGVRFRKPSGGRVDNPNTGRFCGAKCQGRAKRIPKQKCLKLGQRLRTQCPACDGSVLVGSSDKCASCGRTYAAATIYAKRVATYVERTISCEWCGSDHTYMASPRSGRTRRHCSARCCKRAHKYARRMKTTGEAEDFTSREIYDRDGWTCQGCKRPTPERWVGTNEPNAPVLDHIIPLAEGGKHTRTNTQCLCRDCNNLKGAHRLTPSGMRKIAENALLYGQDCFGWTGHAHTSVWSTPEWKRSEYETNSL